MSDCESNIITCPRCHKDMAVESSVTGTGENAVFTCIFCGEIGKNPLS